MYVMRPPPLSPQFRRRSGFLWKQRDQRRSVPADLLTLQCQSHAGWRQQSGGRDTHAKAFYSTSVHLSPQGQTGQYFFHVMKEIHQSNIYRKAAHSNVMPNPSVSSTMLHLLTQRLGLQP